MTDDTYKAISKHRHKRRRQPQSRTGRPDTVDAIKAANRAGLDPITTLHSQMNYFHQMSIEAIDVFKNAEKKLEASVGPNGIDPKTAFEEQLARERLFVWFNMTADRAVRLAPYFHARPKPVAPEPPKNPPEVQRLIDQLVDILDARARALSAGKALDVAQDDAAPTDSDES